LYWDSSENKKIFVLLTKIVGSLLDTHHKVVRDFSSFNNFEKEGIHKQKGKAITLYPKSDSELIKIAKDIDDYLIHYKLTRTRCQIFGDKSFNKQVSNRLFYRYDQDRYGNYDRPQHKDDYKTIAVKDPFDSLSLH